MRKLRIKKGDREEIVKIRSWRPLVNWLEKNGIDLTEWVKQQSDEAKIWTRVIEELSKFYDEIEPIK